LNFDLVTGFSIAPLQSFSLFGIVIALLSGAFFVFLMVRRLIIGPEAEGLFTLFAINFMLIGIILFGIGLLGEYVGRIYQQVRERPRYLIQAILDADEEAVRRIEAGHMQMPPESSAAAAESAEIVSGPPHPR